MTNVMFYVKFPEWIQIFSYDIDGLIFVLTIHRRNGYSFLCCMQKMFKVYVML